jgi:hypothetical protein
VNALGSAFEQEVQKAGYAMAREFQRSCGVPAELQVFQTGQHGFGKKGGGADHYLDRVEEWLKLNGWLTKVSK